MRIATWNVNSLKARLEKVAWWLDRARPDVLLLQETKLGDADAPTDERPAVSDKEVEKAVQVFTKELDPLAVSVKKAVRQAVAKAGDDVLHDKDVKDTMKKVVKKAVKEAVKEAVQDAQHAQELKEPKSQPLA